MVVLVVFPKAALSLVQPAFPAPLLTRYQVVPFESMTVELLLAGELAVPLLTAAPRHIQALDVPEADNG